MVSVPHKKRITCVQMILNDKQAVVGSMDGTMTLFELSPNPLRKLKVLDYSPGGDSLPRGILSMSYCYQSHTLLSTGQDRRVTYWRMDGCKPFRVVEAAFEGGINGVSVTGD